MAHNHSSLSVPMHTSSLLSSLHTPTTSTPKHHHDLHQASHNNNHANPSTLPTTYIYADLYATDAQRHNISVNQLISSIKQHSRYTPPTHSISINYGKHPTSSRGNTIHQNHHDKKENNAYDSSLLSHPTYNRLKSMHTREHNDKRLLSDVQHEVDTYIHHNTMNRLHLMNRYIDSYKQRVIHRPHTVPTSTLRRRDGDGVGVEETENRSVDPMKAQHTWSYEAPPAPGARANTRPNTSSKAKKPSTADATTATSKRPPSSSTSTSASIQKKNTSASSSSSNSNTIDPLRSPLEVIDHTSNSTSSSLQRILDLSKSQVEDARVNSHAQPLILTYHDDYDTHVDQSDNENENERSDFQSLEQTLSRTHQSQASEQRTDTAVFPSHPISSYYRETDNIYQRLQSNQIYTSRSALENALLPPLTYSHLNPHAATTMSSSSYIGNHSKAPASSTRPTTAPIRLVSNPFFMMSNSQDNKGKKKKVQKNGSKSIKR